MSAVEPNGRDERRDPENRSNAANPASQSSHNSARAGETAATAHASKYDVIVDLLDAALSMTPDERARFLDGLAARHEDRARELRELLEALPDPEFPTDTITPVEHASGSAAGNASNASHDDSHDDSHDPYVGEPLVGEILGGCRLTSVLGRGGIGTVFAAEQVEPPRPVAVKVLRAASARASHVRRFQTEAAALARLEHPAIVRIYASGIARREGLELPYIVMERVTDATNFVDWARTSQRTPREIAACLADICDGMQHGHRRGLIHRDLKPTNILIAADGTPRIIDFGVARIFGETAPRAQETLAGALIGTPAYMAPEQFELPSAEVDTRVDIHALGTILYEALSGRRAYDIPRHLYFDAARIIRATEPVALDRIDRNIPRDLAAIVAKAMAKDREKRYTTMAEFADDLRAFLDGRAVRARPESRSERAVRWIRRNPAWAMAISMTTVALIAAVIFTTVSWQRASHQLMLASLARAATASNGLDSYTTRERLKEVREVAGTRIPPFVYGLLESPFDSNTLVHGPIVGQSHIYSGALSPDRTRWIATGDGPRVTILEIVTGKVLQTEVPNAPRQTWGCGFNDDGSRAIVACENGFYEVTSDGRCVPLLETPLGQVRAILPNPTDPEGVYFFEASRAIRRFPFQATAPQFEVTFGQGTGIGTLSIVGRRMYAAAADSLVYAVDILDDGSLARDMAFAPPSGRGIAVVALPDGGSIVRGLVDGTVEALDGKTGARQARASVRHEVRSVAASPSGAFVFAGDRGGRLHRFRVVRDERTGVVQDLVPAGLQRTLSPDPVWALGPVDDEVVVANIGHDIVQFDFTTRWADVPQRIGDGTVYGVSRFDGQRWRAVGDSGVVRELDLATGSWTDVASIGSPSRFVTMSADGKTVVSWDGKKLRMWNLDTSHMPSIDARGSASRVMQPIEIDAPSSFDRVGLAWSDDQTQLAVALDRRILVLDRTGNIVSEGNINFGLVNTAVWTSANTLFVVSVREELLRTDLVVRGAEVLVTKTDGGSFTYARANGRVVKCQLGGAVDIFPRGNAEVLQHAPEQVLKGHTDVVGTVSFVEIDGEDWVATGGEDGTVRVWRVASGECFFTSTPGDARMRSVQWSPDGTSLIALDIFGNVRFFDTRPRRERLLQPTTAER
jgi:WD40 repeat protein